MSQTRSIIQQTDYIENVLRTDIQYLQSNVTLYKQNNAITNKCMNCFSTMPFTRSKTFTISYSVKTPSLPHFIILWHLWLDRCRSRCWNGTRMVRTKELRIRCTTYNNLKLRFRYCLSDVAQAVTTAGQVRLTYEQYQEASKELTLARNSIHPTINHHTNGQRLVENNHRINTWSHLL